MAVSARGGDHAVAGVICHADRGSQYTSNAYLQWCQDRQMRPSVGKTGVCWDCFNAVAKSFWASLKRECLLGRSSSVQSGATTKRPLTAAAAGRVVVAPQNTLHSPTHLAHMTISEISTTPVVIELSTRPLILELCQHRDVTVGLDQRDPIVLHVVVEPALATPELTATADMGVSSACV